MKRLSLFCILLFTVFAGCASPASSDKPEPPQYTSSENGHRQMTTDPKKEESGLSCRLLIGNEEIEATGETHRLEANTPMEIRVPENCHVCLFKREGGKISCSTSKERKIKIGPLSENSEWFLLLSQESLSEESRKNVEGKLTSFPENAHDSFCNVYPKPIAWTLYKVDLQGTPQKLSQVTLYRDPLALQFFVQRKEGVAAFDFSKPEIRPGDRLQLRVQTPIRDFHVALFMETSENDLVQLFPEEGALTTCVKAHSTIDVPSAKQGLSVPDPKSAKIYAFFFEEQLDCEELRQEISLQKSSRGIEKAKPQWYCFDVKIQK